MKSILNSMDGKKTYIVAGLAGLVVFLHIGDILPAEQTYSLLSLLGVGSIATIRHAIQKLNQDVTDN